MRARVLVVDDKESFLALFRRIVPPDLEVVCLSDGARALELLTAERFDLVVSDVRMPGLDGLSLLRRIRESGIAIEVVMMTAYGTIADAVRAMKYGAADYLTKPFDPDDAVAAIEQALVRRSAKPAAGTAHVRNLVGHSPAMKRLVDAIDRAAALDVSVLITGESGTGKALVARTIHERSARGLRPFLSVNCGAHPEPVLEVELFGLGDEGGSPSAAMRSGILEQAASGTLFLDEVGEVPPVIQAKLSCVLEQRTVRRVDGVREHPVDVRIIAAADGDLRRAVEGGRWSGDLYQRLSIITLEVPPLRDRREDIPALADGILARLPLPDGRAPRLSPDALACLTTYEWPGNVTELEVALARASAIAKRDELGASALPSEVRGGGVTTSSRPVAPLVSLPYREAIAIERERATREYLIALLRDVNGNVTQAAERAGIERESFHRLMKRHNVRAEDYRTR